MKHLTLYLYSVARQQNWYIYCGWRCFLYFAIEKCWLISGCRFSPVLVGNANKVNWCNQVNEDIQMIWETLHICCGEYSTLQIWNSLDWLESDCRMFLSRSVSGDWSISASNSNSWWWHHFAMPSEAGYGCCWYDFWVGETRPEPQVCPRVAWRSRSPG